MAFIVGGFRFSEQEFQQSAAQLNTSLLTLAVIALVLPSAFAFAIAQVSTEDKERDVILEMSRGSALILIFIYGSYMVFQLYSHSHLYNPQNDVLLDENESQLSPLPEPHVSPQRPSPRPSPYGRHNSLAFGSAAALGRGNRERPFPVTRNSNRGLEKQNELR